MPLIKRMTEQTSRFSALLAAMLLDLVLAPFIALTPVGFAGTRAMMVLVLLAALFAVRTTRVSIALFALAATAHVAEALWGGPVMQALKEILRIAFLVYIFYAVVRQVLSEREVSVDTIAGAACAYVLIGIVWGEVFVAIEHFGPGAFDVPASFIVGPEGGMRVALFYFSFVTLTTVGYGDIHPASPGLGALAVTEAIMGQLFLAVTVARLVGLHTAQPKE